MADDDILLIMDLTTNELDIDWLRAARLKEACEGGDALACQQLRDMESTRMYSHDVLAASKEPT